MFLYKNDYEKRALDGEYVLTPFLDLEEQREIKSINNKVVLAFFNVKI